MNEYNSDNVIGMSNFPHRNVQNENSFNTLINLQKIIYTKSSVSINDETTDHNNMSEEISSHQNYAEIIDHACDNSGITLVNT